MMNCSSLPYFLDVQHSFSGFSWIHRMTQRQEMLALAMAQGGLVPEIVARILAGRNVQPDEAIDFLDPKLRRDLPDPLSLTDMSVVAERIVRAILEKEKIAIFGDYDVDGATSVALFKRFLRHFGIEPEIYIPDRIFEGYGPNCEAMKNLAQRVSLIITVDCGSNSIDPIACARDAGCEVIVIDHHQVGGALPCAVGVVNPNREDDLSGQGHLCAAGVVFLTLVQISRILRHHICGPQPDLLALLDLVALATICDVVTLSGVNRAFVTKGLLALQKMNNPGLMELVRVSGIHEPVNTFHLGFLLGPRINAGGRIGDTRLGARLLSTDDAAEAREIAGQLNQLNRERQAMEREMLSEALAQVDEGISDNAGSAIPVVSSDRWHPGVVGLIAARLKEHTGRPCFAVHFHPDSKGVGSGRSIPGFDIGALVREAVLEGLLIKGGGHAMAAGMTLDRACLSELRAFFSEKARVLVESLHHNAALDIDGALSADSVSHELLQAIERAGPYGPGHPAPVFVLPHHRISRVYIVGTHHVKAELVSLNGTSIKAIAFRAAQTPLGASLLSGKGKKMHLAGTPELDFWQGNPSFQFRIIDAAQDSSFHLQSQKPDAS